MGKRLFALVKASAETKHAVNYNDGPGHSDSGHSNSGSTHSDQA